MKRRLRLLLLLAVLVLSGSVFLVWAAPQQQANLFEAFLLQTRQDIEVLANQVLGEGVRPPNWTLNADLSTVTFAADLWFDNEQLADAVYGVGERPPGWFGATSPLPEILSRNVRHDLELMADVVFGGSDRPDSWNGASLIYRCDRTLQNLVRLLDQIYNVRPETPQSVVDYCAAVRFETENELIAAIFAAPEIQAALPAQALALRGDLERLADEVLGLNNRPNGWIRNVEENSPSLLQDAVADLEVLADLELGNGVRPPEWATVTGVAPVIGYRNARFNLELLSDAALGVGVRPNGWQGETSIERCTAIEQALITAVTVNFAFVVDDTLADSADFCSLTVFGANNQAENPPAPEVIEGEATEEGSRFIAEARFAFAYLDVAALQYMGIMPGGTEFRAWYRNFNESNMMFVSGVDFAVFIDQRFTTLPREIFDALPTLEGVRPLTFCDAAWCNGPSPTPTPTGGGPLLLLLNNVTPVATRSVQEVAQEGQRVAVSWNHIRVTYLLDNPTSRTVQVALEICAEPAQIACEPVTRVFDNSTGQEKPVISTYNGLNVYEFAYGYITNVIIEGATRVSPDIWISDPTIR
ncbi:MAG: hypothetical protein SF029_07740 [bacterium]|nr:hypothetical protein [bacterium]